MTPDPAMTAKLLQWANSVYANGGAIYDVRRAVERIGVDALAQLALADDVVRSGTSSEVIPGFGVDLFHRHARQVAKVAAGLTDGSHADLAGADSVAMYLRLAAIEADNLIREIDCTKAKAPRRRKSPPPK